MVNPLPIIIIGAGPAGCAAAITLARRDTNVLLIESKPFPRIKVCGEFLSPVAMPLLERLIGLEALQIAGARPVRDFVLDTGNREFPWPMPAPGWALSREALDTSLLDEARRAGAAVLQPERVLGVDYTAASIVVRTASSGPIRARIVIHADGSGRHDPSGPVPNRCAVVALKCHYRPREPVIGVRIRSFPGAYLGTMQVESGLATCAMVLRADRLKAKRPENQTSADGAIDAAVEPLFPDWRPEARSTPWLACGVPASGYIQPGDPRSFRIGNAAAALEPVGGEGIALALWAGCTLGEALTHHAPRADPVELRRVQTRFALQYRAALRMRRPACRAAAAVLEHPRILSAARTLMSAGGPGFHAWWSGTGKPGARATTCSWPSEHEKTHGPA